MGQTSLHLQKLRSLISAALVLFAAMLGCGGRADRSVPRTATIPAPDLHLGENPQQTFYVSPHGDDANPGTLLQPFASIIRAGDAVRQANSDMHGDIVVYLRQGVYRLNVAWELAQQDSGTNGHRVVWAGYPGEHVTISGGVEVRNWTQDLDGRWSADTSLDNFRQLYVEGRRATRGRTGLSSAVLVGDTATPFGSAAFVAQNPEMLAWRNPGDMELGFYEQWTHMICGVQGIDPASGSEGLVSIAVSQPCLYLIKNKNGTQAGLPAYVENALELTASPGQFYLDRSNHRVYYVPRPDEDMHTADVVAPALQTLLTITGTPDTPAANIAFTNLSFEHTSWLETSQVGFVEVQAAFRMPQDLSRFQSWDGTLGVPDGEFEKTPGGIVLTYTHNVIFERCTFMHMGGSGIDLQLGSQDNLISGARVTDISANGIQIGDVQRQDHHPTDSRNVVRENRLVNSYVHDTGAEYLGSVAVFVGYTDGTVIDHNEIAYAPYTGVSVGWGWGIVDPGYSGTIQPSQPYTTPTPARNNLIANNNIHDVMQRSRDGGAIYTLGAQPGTAIQSNLVHDILNPPGGIYLDEGSSGITVTGNAVFGLRGRWEGEIVPIFLHISDAQKASCSIGGNVLNNPGAAALLAGSAGLQPAYQDLLH